MAPRMGSVFVPNPLNYKQERTRLYSFAGFPRNSLDERQLAAAGFFYTKSGDIVRCAFCGVEVGEWEEGDNPIEEHKKWSKTCKFLRDEDVGNIPLGSADQPPLSSLSDYDHAGEPEIKDRLTSCLEHLKISKKSDPIHPSFVTLESRLNSYGTWPAGTKLKPRELAEAGFFYTGLADKTVCFQCGGGLKLWKETDCPWEEHALFFSKCPFVISQKGQDFVTKVFGPKPESLDLKDVQNQASSSPTNYNVPLELDSPSDLSCSSKCNKDSNPRTCKICLREDLEVLFLPCGHIVSCSKCAASTASCVVCHRAVSASVRVYIS